MESEPDLRLLKLIYGKVGGISVERRSNGETSQIVEIRRHYGPYGKYESCQSY